MTLPYKVAVGIMKQEIDNFIITTVDATKFYTENLYTYVRLQGDQNTKKSKL